MRFREKLASEFIADSIASIIFYGTVGTIISIPSGLVVGIPLIQVIWFTIISGLAWNAIHLIGGGMLGKIFDRWRPFWKKLIMTTLRRKPRCDSI